MIAQRKSLAEASERRPGDVSPALVALLYARFLGSVSSDSKQKPSAEQAARASQWLAIGATQ